MSFFTNFPQTYYRFGNESSINVIENLAAYVDVIDDVKNNSAFYQKYTILNGDRPDVLSQKLYGTVNYYWTFYLMNDHIRRQGWPVEYNDLLAKAKKDYPNTTIVTRDLMFERFDVGDTITGVSSAAQAKIIRRNLDLGQLIVQITNNRSFTDAELISDGNETITVNSSSAEYLSAHHYKNSDGNIVDIDPENGPGGLLTEVTYLDRYVEANETLKEINVIQPAIINDIIAAFQRAMSG